MSAILDNYKQLFSYYKQLGDKAMSQLDEDDKYFWTPEANSNSIAIIIQHLHGNMLSRWTDFLTSEGEKTWRNREQEFQLYANDKEELMSLWNAGWDCLFTALISVTDSNKHSDIVIRNQKHTIDQAVQRQLAHYSYHVGQIVFLSKIIVSDSWSSLSIPKGQSTAYNKKKFDQALNDSHFTEDFVKKE